MTSGSLIIAQNGLCKVQFHAFADNAGHIKLWAFVDLDPDDEVCIAKP